MKLIPTFLVALSTALALIGAFSERTKAEAWYLGSTTEDGVKFFIDRDSVTKSDKALQVKIFAVYQQPEKDGLVGYVGTHLYACKDKKVQYFKLIDLYENGSVKPESPDQEWYKVQPETVNEVLMKEVCGNQTE
jgi:hypothetical protein